MQILIVALRLVHVVSGALWVGFVMFTVFYLVPSVQEAGPDGGKVMAAMQRRGVMAVTPMLALATLLSGLWLYWRVSGGFQSGFMRSGTGMTFGLGAAAAIVAYAIGMIVMRPAMLRAAALMQDVGALAPGERERRVAESGRLRKRGADAGRAVALLLLVAVSAMAVARYV